MAWVRIDDRALSHPKIVGLSSYAFHAWVWGLAYCQQHLTDGRITLDAISPRFRRAVDALSRAGLWDCNAVTKAISVHDYLDWNDSREEVRARQRKATQRVANWRAKNEHRDVTALRVRPVTALVTPPLTKPNQTSTESKEHSLRRHSAPPDPRIKIFLTWFQAEYKARRQGADYFVKWAKHATIVKQLLGASDEPRLRRLAQIMLSEKCEEDFIVQTDRGIEILSAKFNWLSDRLAAWEARQRNGDSHAS